LLSTPAVKEFVVEGSNYTFVPSQITVKLGDTVRVIFKNSDGLHDWRLDEFNAATKKIQGGQSETIEFVANKAGTFEYYCSVGNHRQMGMKGTLMVTP
jgi:plastocyanin